MSITGGQADWYVDKIKKNQDLWKVISKTKQFHALFLVSTTIALERLKKKSICLYSPIIMDDRSKCFHEKSVIYKMFDKDIRDIIRKQSRYMCRWYGYKLLLEQYRYNGELYDLYKRGKSEKEIFEKIVWDALGYEGSEALMAFEYNTPNNSLPIIWAEQNGWCPLFKRYDKIYSSQAVRGIKNENIYI